MTNKGLTNILQYNFFSYKFDFGDLGGCSSDICIVLNVSAFFQM